jgi:hypothetical protein
VVAISLKGGFGVPLLVAGSFSLLGAFAYLVIVPEIRPIQMPEREEGVS